MTLCKKAGRGEKKAQQHEHAAAGITESRQQQRNGEEPVKAVEAAEPLAPGHCGPQHAGDREHLQQHRQAACWRSEFAPQGPTSSVGSKARTQSATRMEVAEVDQGTTPRPRGRNSRQAAENFAGRAASQAGSSSLLGAGSVTVRAVAGWRPRLVKSRQMCS
jgi:hypothetical protein